MNHIVALCRIAIVLAAAGVTVTFCAAQDATALKPTHGIIQIATDQTGTPLSSTSTSKYSLNWSGYVLPSYTTAANYSTAQAAWTVPAVTYKGTVLEQKLGISPPQQSSTWVGIGGYCEASNCSTRDTTLIQLGTAQEAIAPGIAVYYAWYELAPAAPVVIPKLVRAGDSITASLSCGDVCTAGTSQSWALSIVDSTAGWKYSTTVTYTSPLLSAEWILEAPTSSIYGIVPLPDYTLESFIPVSANGSNPGLAAADSITMIDPWGASSTPSAATGGDEFNTCWGSTFKPVACNAPTD